MFFRLTLGFALLSAIGCGLVGNSGAPSEFGGVWAVTMTYKDGSCPDVTGGTQAAMWTVNTNENGSFQINVQGNSEITSLKGNTEKSHISLVGVGKGYSSALTSYKLTGSASEITGQAIQTREGKGILAEKTVFGESKKDAWCAVIWDVKASKQGK